MQAQVQNGKSSREKSRREGIIGKGFDNKVKEGRDNQREVKGWKATSENLAKTETGGQTNEGAGAQITRQCFL